MKPVERVDFLSGWPVIADKLNVSVSTAQRWHKKRPLPITYVGGTPTTTRAKLQAWANNPGANAGGEANRA